MSPQPLDQDKEALKAEVEKLNGELENMRRIIMNGELDGADGPAIQKLIEDALQPMAESLQTEREQRERAEEELSKVSSGERPRSADGQGLEKRVNKLVSQCKLLRAKYKIKHPSFEPKDTSQDKLNKCIDIIKAANARKLSGAAAEIDYLVEKSQSAGPPTGSSLEEQVEYYQSRLKKTQQQAAKLSADLHGVMDMNDHLSGESTKLQGQVEDAQRKTDQMTRKNSKLKSQVAKLRDEVRNLGGQVDQFGKAASPAHGESEESAKQTAREAKSDARGLENSLQRARAELATSQKVAARLQDQNTELERKVQRLQAEKEAHHVQLRDVQRTYENQAASRDVGETSEILDMWKKRDEQAMQRAARGGVSGQTQEQLMMAQQQLVNQKEELAGAKQMKDALERELEAQAGVSNARSKTLVGLQEKLQQHFSKTYDELNEWKKREQDIKEKNRALENELQQKTAENVRLRQKIKMLESSGKKGRRRRRSSAGIEDKPSSSDAFSDTSSGGRSGDAMSRTDVGRKISSMRQQLTQMQKDRQRVFEEILKPIGSPMASPMSQPHRSPASGPRRLSSGRQRLDGRRGSTDRRASQASSRRRY